MYYKVSLVDPYPPYYHIRIPSLLFGSQPENEADFNFYFRISFVQY